MRILMIAAEAEPFAKGGGLGDAVSGLASSLASQGAEVTVALPLYSEVLRRGHRPGSLAREVALAHDGRTVTARLFGTRLEGVGYLFIGEDGYFAREGIYGDLKGEFPDSPLRFSFLTRAALAGAEALGLSPEAVHTHDWHAALAPWYLPAGGPRPPVLLTIHNLAYQGVCGADLLGPMGLPPRGFTMEGFEFHGRINFLKGGITAADLINTVSPTYAREILTQEGGEGLEGALLARRERPAGILNGIDQASWDPAADPALPRAFTSRAIAGKRACKKALQRELGLAPEAGSPLFAFVGRLARQKGVELAAKSLPGLFSLGGQFALLGTGERRYMEIVEKALAGAPPGRAAARFLFDPAMARRLYAGCDFLLMPSLFEPCGLGQMYAMRYGSLPVAHRTGGLSDTVRDLTIDPVAGNGFLFDDSSTDGLTGALARAAGWYYGKVGHKEVLRRVMEEDHSWRSAGRKYLALFDALPHGGKEKA